VAPRVSRRRCRWHKYYGVKFSRGTNICDTLGGRISAASNRDRQTNKRMDSVIALTPHFGGGGFTSDALNALAVFSRNALYK